MAKIEEIACEKIYLGTYRVEGKNRFVVQCDYTTKKGATATKVLAYCGIDLVNAAKTLLRIVTGEQAKADPLFDLQEFALVVAEAEARIVTMYSEKFAERLEDEDE